jgi:hypothetical protein
MRQIDPKCVNYDTDLDNTKNLYNRPFANSWFAYHMFIYLYYMSYFPYDKQNGTWSSKSNRKNNDIWV